MLAAGFLLGALRFQSQASEPRGEGELFFADAQSIDHLLESPMDIEEAVRHARNALEVEAVSIIDQSGVIVSSTSATLRGDEVLNPLLAFGSRAGRFTALAGPIADPIEIDGVVEWPAGSVLYQVVSPLSDDQSSLVHYDLTTLLARRAQPGRVQPETVQLLVLSGLFALIGGGVMAGHVRAARRYRAIAVESELLRRQSIELEQTNFKLLEARNAAETALALAEEKIRVRSEFVLMINHELRTPLTSVVTGAQLLRDRNLTNEETRGVIEAMVSDGHRLQEIIDQILAVARIENRGLSAELRPVSIDDLCATIGSSQDDPHDPSLRAHTDLNTIKLVVSSLVDNARTHGASEVTVACGTEPSVKAMLEVGSRPLESVFVRVGDNGPGIDESFLPRMFEKFEKSSFSPGTGLGLYMVRVMIESLGGAISVATSPSGTMFEIALPAASTRTMAISR